MTPLAAIKVAQGEPFGSSFTVVGQDWTGYTGTVTYKTAPQGDLILETTATGDAAGEVEFGLTAEQTALFPARAVLGFRKVGVYQVRMTDGTDTQTFQENLFTAGSI